MMKSRLPTSSRYVLGALITNFLAFLIYCIFQFLFNPKAPVTSLISASLCVMPISYLFNRNLVFDSTNTKRKEFTRFFSIYLSAIIVSSAALVGIHQVISNPYLAQFVNMTTIGIVTYLVHSKWTFMKTDHV